VPPPSFSLNLSNQDLSHHILYSSIHKLHNMDFDTDEVLVGDTFTTTNAEASGSGTQTFPPNLAALPSKRGQNPTGINGKRPSRKSLSQYRY